MSEKIYNLTDENINSLIEDIKAYFVSRKVADRDVLKLGLF